MERTFHRRRRLVLGLTLFASILFLLIGARFIFVPESAARTFGLASQLGTELHVVVGLRDLWLAGLALGFAVLREWRALALWFALGGFVCFADSLVVAGSSANPWAIGFHAVSGLFCFALAWLSWLLASAGGDDR